MEYRPQDILAVKHGKKETRLVAQYRGRLLEVAKLGMTSGGSFIFCLTSPTSNIMKISTITVRQGQKQVSPGPNEKAVEAKDGFHFSLHPPSTIDPSIGNTAHIRSNATAQQKGTVHDSVVNDWYPVTSPRNILNFYTAPMATLLQATNTSHFAIPIPEVHTGSLRGKVDFYPSNTKTITRYKSCFNEVHGYCPSYRILISFFLHAPTTPGVLYPVKASGL